MDHNLEDIDFENPLNGSILDISVHEKVAEQYTCDMSDLSYFKKSNI